MAMQQASGNWKLDADDGGGAGLALNSHSRVMLMAKLGETAGLSELFLKFLISLVTVCISDHLLLLLLLLNYYVCRDKGSSAAYDAYYYDAWCSAGCPGCSTGWRHAVNLYSDLQHV